MATDFHRFWHFVRKIVPAITTRTKRVNPTTISDHIFGLIEEINRSSKK